MAAQFAFYRVSVRCFADSKLNRNFFMRVLDAEETIGDALFRHLENLDVSISKIRASTSLSPDIATETEPDTPAFVLREFNTKQLFVDIVPKGMWDA